MSITLSPQQDTAVRTFQEWWQDTGAYARHMGDKAPYFLQEGYAGTGKSTVLPFMIEATGLELKDIGFMAPTGKAAKVMTRKMRDQNMGAVATTIHKQIYRPKGLSAFSIEAEIFALNQRLPHAGGDETREINQKLSQLNRDLQRAYMEDTPSFQINPESAVSECKLLVIDEASMVSEEVADDLRSFGVPILAIGDPGQLPPVGGRPGFCNRKPDHLLEEIHRQAADNPIIWASMQIRAGKDLPVGEHGGGLLRVVRVSDDDVTYDMTRDVQIICGTNRLRWEITRNTRRLCGFDYMGPMTGEMMICIKNSKDYPLVNGSMGIVTADTGTLKSGDITCKMFMQDEDGTNYELKCLQAVFEETYLGKGQSTSPPRAIFMAKQNASVHQFDWAYAITCHKSQGSQWDEVVVHDESMMFRDEWKRWLYTAVTRAAERLTVVV